MVIAVELGVRTREIEPRFSVSNFPPVVCIYSHAASDDSAYQGGRFGDIARSVSPIKSLKSQQELLDVYNH